MSKIIEVDAELLKHLLGEVQLLRAEYNRINRCYMQMVNQLQPKFGALEKISAEITLEELLGEVK